MESDYNQDLPFEILDKLRNLELELEDGDINLKGFEKKKASLLASNPTTPTSPIQKTDAEILEELGPEPSAADVVDFLDFLPSPTHSPPTRNATANIGATFMEENHRQLQPQHQQHQQQPLPPQLQPQLQQMQHQPYPQQVRPIQTQYRPYNQSRPMMNNPSYYQGSPLPSNTSSNRPPYNMVPRPQPQQSQQRPMNIPPGSNPYYVNQRPPSSISPLNYRPSNNSNYQQQRPVVYNSNQNIPQQTSPRPMYRPQPRPNTNFQPYRPQQQQQQQQQQVYTQPNNSMRNSELQYGNYPYNNSNGVNRSLSTSTGTNVAGNHTDQRQYHSMSMYSTRSDSMEWNQ